MSTLQQAFKNEYTKRLMRVSGVRPPQRLPRSGTPHYRMPKLEANGGYIELEVYRGPEIASSEWESLTYTTYASDPHTYFAPDHLGHRAAGDEALRRLRQVRPRRRMDRQRREVPHDRDLAAVHRRQVRAGSAAADEPELAGRVPVGLASGQQQPEQPRDERLGRTGLA